MMNRSDGRCTADGLFWFAYFAIYVAVVIWVLQS